MTYEDFKQDTIALLNSRVVFDDEVLDAIMYNCVKLKEHQRREDADIMDGIGNVGLTD
jgi:hypothetical protein